MTTNYLKNKNLYFYLFIAAPLVLPVVYYFTQSGIGTNIAFYVAAFICMYLDQKEMVKSATIPESDIVNSVLWTAIFPPAYVFFRAKDVGMKKWVWFLVCAAIGFGSAFVYLNSAKRDSVRTTACEVTTSIFKDKNSDVTCLAVEDLNKVSDKHYRAKAALSNGMDIPITIEEANDDYIYVTLAPLSSLLE